MKYRQEIDGLRAIAVIAVIVNHFNRNWLPGGHLGVDIFFVISGYVITASLHARGATSLADLLTGFYARRVKRLLPALAAFVLGTALLISLVNPTPGVTLKTGMAALFGVGNIYLARLATDYFGDAAQLNAFTHTWSLGVEEQYYLLFPLIVGLTGFGRRSGRSPWPFFGVMTLLSLASLAGYILLPNLWGYAAVHFFMPTRFWELGAGTLAYWLTQRFQSPGQPSHGWLRELLAFAALLAALVTLCVPSAYDRMATMAITAWSVALIVLTSPFTKVGWLLTRRAMVYVGLISYSLYLWHWTVLVLSRYTIGVHGWTVPIQVLLMLALAAASYHLVERPLRHARWSDRQGPTLAYGAAITLLVALLLLPWLERFEGRMYMGERPPLEALGTATLTNDHSVAGTTWRGQQCVLSGNSDVGKIITPRHCTLGDFERAKTRVLVIGNSQSASFTHAFDALVAGGNVAVTITSAWGASAVPEVRNNSPWREAGDYYWSHTVPALVATLKPGDWVLMINELTGYAPAVKLSPDHVQVLQQLHDGIARLSDELARRSVKLAVVHGLPFMRDAQCDPGAGIPQWFAPEGPPCKLQSREASLQQRIPLDGVMVELASQQKITLIDLFDAFCPGEVCSNRGAQGALLYRDVWAHPSVEAARLVAPYFSAAFQPDVRVAATTQQD